MARGSPLSPPFFSLSWKLPFFAAARIAVFFFSFSLAFTLFHDGENRPHSERRRQSLAAPVFSVEVNKVPWKEFSRRSSNNWKLSRRKWHRYLFRRKIVHLFTTTRKLRGGIALIAIISSRHEPSSCSRSLAAICHRSSFSINRSIDRLREEKMVTPLLSYPKYRAIHHLALLISYALSIVTFARGESNS